MQGAPSLDGERTGGLTMTNAELIERVQAVKLTAGKAEYLKHLRGEPLTRAEAVRAFCFECQGYYLDRSGVAECDCKKVRCPLYVCHPYKRS